MIADIAVQLATVFVGAYLAFAAEELRQRRQTREWAKTHLRQLGSLFADEAATAHFAEDMLAAQAAALDVWLGAQDPDQLDDEQWERIVTVVTARAPDLSALLRGEPVALLPVDLALSLAGIEALGRNLESATADVRAMRERILPLWAARKAPLSEAERRMVGLYRENVMEFSDVTARTVATVRAVVTQIEPWVGVRRRRGTRPGTR